MKRIFFCLAALTLLASCSYDIRLGQTDNGDVVTFTRTGGGAYGVTVKRANGHGHTMIFVGKTLLPKCISVWTERPLPNTWPRTVR